MMDRLINAKNVIINETILEDNENYESAPYKLRGCVLTVVERLDEEFVKLLKECDPHSNEYVERYLRSKSILFLILNLFLILISIQIYSLRLKDETRVCYIIDKVQEYLERQSENDSELCRIYMRKIEHLYYKFDPQVLSQKQGKIPLDTVTSVQVMDKLCKFVYDKDQTDRLRTRAILSHVYHHALHDNWFQARDLILMSHLQENIQHSDPPTQVTLILVGESC